MENSCHFLTVPMGTEDSVKPVFLSLSPAQPLKAHFQGVLGGLSLILFSLQSPLPLVPPFILTPVPFEKTPPLRSGLQPQVLLGQLC